MLNIKIDIKACIDSLELVYDFSPLDYVIGSPEVTKNLLVDYSIPGSNNKENCEFKLICMDCTSLQSLQYNPETLEFTIKSDDVS